jgi:hypothetical protein
MERRAGKTPLRQGGFSGKIGRRQRETPTVNCSKRHHNMAENRKNRENV